MMTKTNMKKQEILDIASSISHLASSIERKVFYVLLIGIFSTITIAWQWLDFSHLSPWSAIKASILLLPIILWFTFWQVVQQLTTLPEALEDIKETSSDSIQLFNSFSPNSPSSPKNIFSRVFRLIKTLRDPEIIQSVLACVKGLTLLMNPLLLFTLFLSFCAIFLFVIIALLILIF